MRACLVLVIGAAVIGLLSGCAPETTAERPTEKSISNQQRDALADRTVTFDEYQTGFDAYRACLQQHGIELQDVGMDGDLIDFRIPGEPSEDDQDCYSFNWEQVDDAWQMAHQDSSPSAEVVKRCLEHFGTVPKAGYADNLALLTTLGKTVADCPA